MLQTEGAKESDDDGVGPMVLSDNHEHRHSGIRFVTPHQRHTGLDIAILKERDELYKFKKAQNPSRWSSGTRNWQPAGEVELNPENTRQTA